MKNKIIAIFLIFNLFAVEIYADSSKAVENSSSSGFGQILDTVANYSKKIFDLISGRRKDLENKIEDKRKMLQATTKLVKKINENLRQSTSYAQYLSDANIRCRKNHDNNIQLVNKTAEESNWQESTRKVNLERYDNDFQECLKKTSDLGTSIIDVKAKLNEAKEFLANQGLDESLLKNEISQLEFELKELTRLVESKGR